ncbi:MAG TPA: site-specific integrase [Casimicrobiaceae bacterium]|nr:site-specific integrase [Casimicrobiaceae bacterium]
MSLFKRGEIWWVDFKVNGKRTRVSTGTRDRKQAQELHDSLKARAWREEKLDAPPSHTWEDAAVRWLREKADKKDHDNDCRKIAWFTTHLKGKPLTEITSDLIVEIVEKHLADRKGSTRNRFYALICAIMRRAVTKWKWLDAHHLLFIEHHKEEARERFLEPDELLRLLKELPEHLRSIAACAVATGLRMSKVVGMQWKWVNLAERTVTIPGALMKNGRPIVVPLNDLAYAVIERQVGAHPEHVFVFKGKPIRAASNTAWYKALKRAGLEGFTFHGLRHTWASYMAQNGASERELMELGGWLTPAMARRYGHLRVKHLVPAAGIIDRVVSVDRLLSVAQA